MPLLYASIPGASSQVKRNAPYFMQNKFCAALIFLLTGAHQLLILWVSINSFKEILS